MSPSSRAFSTGLSFLDRRLDGGVPAGGMLAISTPPASQSQLLLEKLAAQRETQLVSTTCPSEEELRDRFASATPGLTVGHETPAAILDDPAVLTERVTPESFLIVDSVAGLETADRERYLDALNSLKAELRSQDSAAVLHCPRADRDLPQRWLTLERSDHVWRLEVETDPQDITYRLLIVKARGQRVVDTPLPLELGETVDIDTSRSI